jgi:hypothetical protein
LAGLLLAGLGRLLFALLLARRAALAAGSLALLVRPFAALL